MTSAPNCARRRPAKGPAYPVVKLMIRTPSRILLVLSTEKPPTQCKMQSANLKIKNDFAFCLLQFAFALDPSVRHQDFQILPIQTEFAAVDLSIVLTQERRRRRLEPLAVDRERCAGLLISAKYRMGDGPEKGSILNVRILHEIGRAIDRQSGNAVILQQDRELFLFITRGKRGNQRVQPVRMGPPLRIAFPARIIQLWRMV